MRRPSRLTLASLAAALALVAGACGDDDDTIPQTGNRPTTTAAEGAENGAAFPVTIEDAANGRVEIAARPEQIVSLSPTATEMLYAIGAGDQVAAVDELSDHPEGTPITDLSGFETNVEAVADEDPDLVLMANDNNDAFAGFAELDIPVLQLPSARTLDDTYTQLDQLGMATGHVEEATEVADTMRTRIEELVGVEGLDRDEEVTVYHEIDDTYYSTTPETFLGELYDLAGLRNIATQSSPDGSGYVQLSAEYVIQQDPDWIFLAWPVEGDPVAAVSGRPGWSRLTAVREGHVVALDPDLASRWGPRAVDLLQLILDSTEAPPPETTSTSADAGEG